MLLKPFLGTFNRRFLTISFLLLLATGIWSAYSQQYPSSSGGDDIVEHTPDRIYDASVYRSGHIPIWNPYLFSGIDQPAVIQPGVFYPPNIVLYAIFSGVVAHNLMIVAHILLAFYFMRQFLKLHNLTDWAATLGALTLVFGSVTISFIEAIPNSNARVWVIAAFYFLERFIQSRRIIFCAWMGACIGLILLAGWPQTVVLGGVYLLLYAVVSLRGYPKKKVLIAGFIAAFLFSAVIGMVQILPTLELKKHSNLSDLSYSFFGTCAVPPVLFVQMFIPFLFGSSKPLPVIPWLGPVNMMAMQIYVGILPLMFAAVATTLWKRSRLVLFGVLAFVGSLLLAAATFTPLGHLLYRIPAYNFFRDHYYHFYFTTFAIAILTACAISALEKGEVSARLQHRLARVVPLSFVFIFAVILAARHSLFRILQKAPHGWWPGYHHDGHLALKLTNPGTLAALAVLLLSIPVFLLKLRYPESRRVNWLIVAAFALVMGSFSTVMYSGPTPANPPASETAIIKRLKELSSPGSDRIYSAECCDHYLHVHNNEEIPVADIMGYGSLYPYPYSDLLLIHGGGRTASWAELILNHRILSLLNVRYLVVDSEQLARLRQYMPIPQDGQAGRPTAPETGPDLLEGAKWEPIGPRASVSPVLKFAGVGTTLSGVQHEGLKLQARTLYELSFDFLPENLDATGFGISIGHGDTTKYMFVLRVIMTEKTAPYKLLYVSPDEDEEAAVKFFGDTPVPFEISNVRLRRVAGLPLDGSHYKVVETGDGMILLENSDVMPRAFFPKQLVEAGQYADARAALWSMTNSLDLRTTAMVQDLPDAGSKRISAGEVRNIAYGEGKVKLSTHCADECFLVLTDRYSPEWQAKIDGQGTKIYPTNAVVRGVLVPAGDHQVEFAYRPRFQMASLLVTSISALGLLLFTFFSKGRAAGERSPE